MTQSFSFWDILERSVCAYRGPAATIVAAPITIPIVSETLRIAHPPCDVAIRVLHRREQAQNQLDLAAQTRPSEKIPGSRHDISPREQFISLIKGETLRKTATPPKTAGVFKVGDHEIVCPPQLACNSHFRRYSTLRDVKFV